MGFLNKARAQIGEAWHAAKTPEPDVHHQRWIDQQHVAYAPGQNGRQVRVPSDEYEDADFQEADLDEEDDLAAGYDPVDEHRAIIAYHGAQEVGVNEKAMRIFVLCTVIFLTPILWFVLGWGNAALYSSLLPVGADDRLIILMYVAGFGYEAGTLALIFVAALRWRKDAKRQAALAMGAAIVLASFSFFTQWYFIKVEISRAMFGLPVSTLQGMPIPLDWLILFRALVPTVLSFCLVFILPERRLNIEETIEEKRKLQRQAYLLQEDAQERQVKEILHTQVLSGLQRYVDFVESNEEVLVQDIKQKTIVQRVQQPVLPEHATSSLQKKAPVQQPAPFKKAPEPLQMKQSQHPQRAFPQQPVIDDEEDDAPTQLPQPRTPVQPVQFAAEQTQYPKTDEEKLAFARSYVRDHPQADDYALAQAMGIGKNPAAARFWRMSVQSANQKQQQPLLSRTPVRDLSKVDLTKARTSMIADPDEDTHFF